MRKMMKAIAAVLAVSALMAGSAFAAPKFTVKGTDGTTDKFVVGDDGSVTSPSLSVTADGRMGLGLTPVNVFDIQKEWSGVLGTNLVTAISVYNDQARYTFRRANGTVASPTAINNGDAIGNMNFRGWDGTKWTQAGVVAITVNAEEAWTPTANGARVIFMTSPKGVAATPTERLRVTANGDIVTGNFSALASGPLPTSATDGHLHIPTVAGAVTSCATMASYVGHAPIWFDTANSKICSCISGALKCTSALQ